MRPSIPLALRQVMVVVTLLMLTPVPGTIALRNGLSSAISTHSSRGDPAFSAADSVLQSYLDSLPQLAPGQRLVLAAEDSLEAAWWGKFVLAAMTADSTAASSLLAAQAADQAALAAESESNREVQEARSRYDAATDRLKAAENGVAVLLRMPVAISIELSAARSALERARADFDQARAAYDDAISSAAARAQTRIAAQAGVESALAALDRIRQRLTAQEFAAILRHPMIVDGAPVPVLVDPRANTPLGLSQCENGPIIYLAKNPRYRVRAEAFLFFRMHELGHLVHHDRKCPTHPARKVDSKVKENEADCFAVGVLDSFPNGNIPIYVAGATIPFLPSDGDYPEPHERGAHIIDGC